ncbi:hypothetical protein L7F22_007303 [Adiantum nelumboides]|nr:hypothetical protein [Adiantum nelumboides]
MLQDSAAGLENCLNFLKGNSDEQRLVGLLLATKYVKGDEKSSVIQIFDADGIQFINRLLKSGIHGTTEQEEAYLQLAISVLSAFCRVPELAASDEITEKIPTLLEVLKKRPKATILTDCLECLIGIASASDQGQFSLKKAGALPMLLDCLATFKSGPDCFIASVKLIQMLMSAHVSEEEIAESAASILSTIIAFAELLSHEQESLKLDILLLLQSLCTPEILVQIHAPKEGRWLSVMRNSIGQVLRSQRAVEQKFLALELAKSIVEYTGSVWLLGSLSFPGESKEMPLDRFFLLLVETLRVESLVLLNEVARSRFQTEILKACSSNDLIKKQHLLATCYFLLESVINVTVEEDDIERLSDVALRRTVSVLNEIINTVIEFLQEGKRQNTTKGDDLLASARLLGRYLADAPSHQRTISKQFLLLLNYLFTITSDIEESPFLVTQFLLPAICEITREKDGCEAFISQGGHKQVIAFMLKAVAKEGVTSGLLVKAADVILNVLQKENQFIQHYGAKDFFPLLSALPSWAVSTNRRMEISMAAAICALILDLTSEEVVSQLTFSQVLPNVYNLLLKVQGYSQMNETSLEDNEDEDLWEITLSACKGLEGRYPSFRDLIQSCGFTS